MTDKKTIRTAPKRPEETNIEYMKRIQHELDGKPCFACDKDFTPFDLTMLMDGERYHTECALTEGLLSGETP